MKYYNIKIYIYIFQIPKLFLYNDNKNHILINIFLYLILFINIYF